MHPHKRKIDSQKTAWEWQALPAIVVVVVESSDATESSTSHQTQPLNPLGWLSLGWERPQVRCYSS